ncbi:MAG TPA: DUF4230 domain-containing protein [Niabella sp.]|jgi:hypothetical protein|nr:DUF4230 domain-containing protein [Chitinophagaceae bacterium]HRN49262.1 DUF4230 domain-containing protein [Niabella sp.]HRO86300.1 DUF4230 domain-containing protein [Niabella sp.]
MSESENIKTEEKMQFLVKDNKGCFLFVIFILAIVLAVMAYFLGKKNGAVTTERLISNTTFLKNIAELSTLEANGSANITSTNILDDGTLTDMMKKLFSEKTIKISVPFTAKYGVSLKNQNIRVNHKDTVVTIFLPEPELLSYELRLDKMDATVRKGLLQSIDEQTLNSLEGKLYSQSRQQMAGNDFYKQEAKNKVQKILEEYFAPLDYNVKLVFDNSQTGKNVKDLD